MQNYKMFQLGKVNYSTCVVLYSDSSLDCYHNRNELGIEIFPIFYDFMFIGENFNSFFFNFKLVQTTGESQIFAAQNLGLKSTWLMKRTTKTVGTQVYGKIVLNVLRILKKPSARYE